MSLGASWVSGVGILVDRVSKVTGGLINDEQLGLRAGRGCIDQIFTLKQMVFL